MTAAGFRACSVFVTLTLLRPAAISGVVYGHWLIADLTYPGGRFSDLNVLDYVQWGRWGTWAFQ